MFAAPIVSIFIFSVAPINAQNSYRAHQFVQPVGPVINDVSDTKNAGPKFSEETKRFLDGMLQDAGNACKVNDTLRDTTKNTLEKTDSELNTLIYQLAALREEDVTEKTGPIKIGPPDVMALALDPKNQDVFYRYNTNRSITQSVVPFTSQRLGNSLDQELIHKGNRENIEIENSIQRALIDSDLKTQSTDIHRASSIAYQIKEARGENPERVRLPIDGPTNMFIGVPTTQKPLFENMQNVREHLHEINKFVVRHEDAKKNQELVVNVVLAGLVSGGISVTLAGIQKTASMVGRQSQQSAESTTAATTTASVAGISLWALFTKDVSDYLSLTFKSSLKSKVTENAQSIFINANEKLSKATLDSQVAFKNADEFFKTLSSEFPGDSVSTSVNPVTLFQNPSALGFVKTADNFSDAIFQIRLLSSEILRAPSLMDATGIKSTSTSGPATQLALMDSRIENNALTINMRAFDIAGENMEVSLRSAVQLAHRKANGEVVDANQVESSIENEFKNMRYSLEQTVKLLQDQRKGFNDAMRAIDESCAHDQMNIYGNWGKSGTLLSNERDAEQVYLANAFMARADCVQKKSLIRNAEMMKIAVTISQLKGNCTQVKTWEKALRIYPKIVGRLR